MSVYFNIKDHLSKLFHQYEYDQFSFHLSLSQTANFGFIFALSLAQSLGIREMSVYRLLGVDVGSMI